MSTYVEAPKDYVGQEPAVFLAGGITGCPDWQAGVCGELRDLPIVILNPRRVNFPIGDPAAGPAQIDWEYRHLQRADVVMFWFPDSGQVPQPIALYELGAHAAAGKKIAVGCNPRYVRRADVIHQLRLARPDVHVRSDLYSTLLDVRALLPTRSVRKTR